MSSSCSPAVRSARTPSHFTFTNLTKPFSSKTKPSPSRPGSPASSAPLKRTVSEYPSFIEIENQTERLRTSLKLNKTYLNITIPADDLDRYITVIPEHEQVKQQEEEEEEQLTAFVRETTNKRKTFKHKRTSSTMTTTTTTTKTHYITPTPSPSPDNRPQRKKLHFPTLVDDFGSEIPPMRGEVVAVTEHGLQSPPPVHRTSSTAPACMEWLCVSWMFSAESYNRHSSSASIITYTGCVLKHDILSLPRGTQLDQIVIDFLKGTIKIHPSNFSKITHEGLLCTLTIQ